MIEILTKVFVCLGLAAVVALLVAKAYNETFGAVGHAEGMSENKYRLYAAFFGKVLWNFALPVLIALAGFAKFLAMGGNDEKDKSNETCWYGGSYWYRDGTGSWYSMTADSDQTAPPPDWPFTS